MARRPANRTRVRTIRTRVSNADIHGRSTKTMALLRVINGDKRDLSSAMSLNAGQRR